jgi:hypothetical protein
MINDYLTTVVAIIKGMRQPSKLIHMIDILSQALSKLHVVPSDARALLKEGLMVCCLVSSALPEASVYMLKKSTVQRPDINDDKINTIYKFCHEECSNSGNAFSDALTVMIAIASRSLAALPSPQGRNYPR